MASPIPVTGLVGGVSACEAQRLSVVALRANMVLALAPLGADGRYLLSLPQAADHPESPFPLQVAVLPNTAAGDPDRVLNAPRAEIAPDALRGGRAVEVPALSVAAGLMGEWSIFWQECRAEGGSDLPARCRHQDHRFALVRRRGSRPALDARRMFRG